MTIRRTIPALVLLIAAALAACTASQRAPAGGGADAVTHARDLGAGAKGETLGGTRDRAAHDAGPVSAEQAPAEPAASTP